MKLREEEFYEQYHQHGGTTIIPTEIFNELYDDATEEIERLYNIIKEVRECIENQPSSLVQSERNIIKILDNVDNKDDKKDEEIELYVNGEKVDITDIYEPLKQGEYFYKENGKWYVHKLKNVSFVIEEDKKIEKLDHLIGYDIRQFEDLREYVEITTNDLFGKTDKIIDKINEIIDYINKGDK